MRVLLCCICYLVLSACGSGGSEPAANATPTTKTQTVYYASGRIAETGAVKIGTTMKVGEWQSFFDLAGSPRQFTGVYADGKLDSTRPWREWNADSSIRADSTDR
jgi:hypothetical protein